MTSLLTTIAGWNLKRRMRQIEHFMHNPLVVQKETMQHLVRAAVATDWGVRHNFDEIETIADFQQAMPVSAYEDLFPYIARMLEGEENVLWHGGVTWFAKSSGTSNDKSKFIPITEESLYDCHFRAGKDLIAIYLHNHNPDSQLFNGKILSINGSHQLHTPNGLYGQARYGDLSAVLLENLPYFYELLRSPTKKVALMQDWEEKMEAICAETGVEDIRAMVGVPTWAMLILQKIIEKSQIAHNQASDIWRNFEVFFHGGVNFQPYRKHFEALFQHKVFFVDVYNASEGFFGIEFEPESGEMLLMLDYGIFYEFVPLEELGADNAKVLDLSQVEVGKNYAMLISTNGGLWRYLIGDTVMFTATHPYKIRVTGRTKHFINAFGEELMIDNADKALEQSCVRFGASIRDYTAAPVYMEDKQAGRHEWLIEFECPPTDFEGFVHCLDEELKKRNSDYDAKRNGDKILGSPLVHALPAGTFYSWMKERGKLGGQHKVPRLSNHRQYVEDIMRIVLNIKA